MKEKKKEKHADKNRKHKEQQALLFINPTSGGSDNTSAVEEIVQALKEENITVEVSITKPKNIPSLIERGLGNGVKLFIICGGDGTIESAARTLIKTKATIGIIPLGTRNNIAASLNIPTNISQAARILAHGLTCPVDMGRIGDFYFMEVVAIGLEASLFPIGDELKEKGVGALTTALAGIKLFSQFRPHTITMKLDKEVKLEFKALQINVCNSPRYGINFSLAPDALMNDGKLDVVYLENTSKWDYVSFFSSLAQRQRPEDTALRTYHAKTITISSSSPMHVHADNKEIGKTPVKIKVVPNAVLVRVPTPEMTEQFAVEDAQRVLTASKKEAVQNATEEAKKSAVRLPQLSEKSQE